MEIALVLGIIAVVVISIILMVDADSKRKQSEMLGMQDHTSRTGHTQFECHYPYENAPYAGWIGGYQPTSYCLPPMVICKECGKVIK